MSQNINLKGGRIVRVVVETTLAESRKTKDLTIYTDFSLISYSLRAITEIDLSVNFITELPRLPDTVLILDCSDNQISTISGLPTLLEILYCSRNKLTELPELPQSLITLFCHKNELKSLPKLPGLLRDLDCSFNQLETIPKLPESLWDLRCDNNNLLVLPKLPKRINRIVCNANPLVFIEPSALTKPRNYVIPTHLKYLSEHWYFYHKRYENYIYLITFLVLESRVPLVLLISDFWWFPANF